MTDRRQDRCGSFLATVGIVLLALVAGEVTADDWPAHRHDLARSGVTADSLAPSMHLQWRHLSPHKPRHAWDEPGRELNRLAFDYAYNVTIAKGVAYFGSSADHKVHAIDLDTGRQRWGFFTGGPVRFAPTIADGRLFVGSDDGWLYCLAAGDGTLLWRFRGGPRREMIMGNQQMVSRWPLRTGAGVNAGTVYFSAGMWPSEGVHVHALRVEDGEEVWHNDTSGTSYVKQPHPGSFSITGVAPQGYVFGHDGQIFIPTGRNVPAAYDSESGKMDYYRGAPTSWSNRWGGSWNMLAGGKMFSWRGHIGPDIPVSLGEYKPDKNDGIVVFDAKTGKELREVPGKLQVVVDGAMLYASGSGKISAYDTAAWIKGGKGVKAKWETSHGRAYIMILAGKTLVIGGAGTVTAIETDKGKVLWQDKVGGQVRDLAAADGRLLASTTEGEIRCYGARRIAAAPKPPKVSVSPFDKGGTDPRAARVARQVLDQTGKRQGFCLALGAGNAQVLYQLARQSDLRIWCVEPDGQKVLAARQALDAAGLYGVRITVHHGKLGELIYPEYLADLIVSPDATGEVLAATPAADIYRSLRPCGGTWYLPVEGFPGGRAALTKWLEAGKVPAEQIVATGPAVRVVRPALPGAGDWTHQYASAAKPGGSTDTLARLPLRPLWFGRPGPVTMVSRHWGGPSPLYVNGRLIVIGQHHITAADAYNGRQIWRREFKGAAWYPVRTRGSSTVADDDSIYLARGATCIRLDAATGRTVQTYRPPTALAGIPSKGTKPILWSYLATADDRILGALGSTREARSIFMSNKAGQTRWTYTAAGVINNNAMALADGRVIFIDAPSREQVDLARKRGRNISLRPTLVALDADTGRTVWRTDKGIAEYYALWVSDGVIVASNTKGIAGYDSATGKQLYVRKAMSRKNIAIADRTIYTEHAGFDLHTGEPKQRVNPLTGEKTDWSFTRSYGCGGISAGVNLLMFRSGTLGFYDLAGDGGVFNFGGVRAGCYINAIAAGGLVMAPPSDAACTCSYSLRTTVALAPASRDDQWSVFYDKLPTTAVRRAKFNLGAPGDRRDETGTMWLAAPRPVTLRGRKDDAAPFRFTMYEGCGAYQFSSGDSIEGADKTWLYASGLRGLQKAEIDLHVLDDGIVAWAADETASPPATATDEPYKHVPLPHDASATFSHDKGNLYVTCARPAATGKDGKPKAWRASTSDDDAEVWKDDSFELYFSTAPERRQPHATSCLHIGLAASGARYDALWKYAPPIWPARNIPRLLDIAIDGKADDWKDRGLHVRSLVSKGGTMRAADNFDQALNVAWNDQGLLVLVKVTDDAAHESSNKSELWKGDAFGILVTATIPAKESYHLVVSPGVDPKFPKQRVRFYDYRRNRRVKLTGKVVCTKTDNGYLAEVLLPWQNLGIKPKAGATVGVQMFLSDEDGKKPKVKTRLFEVAWHPGGHPRSNALAYQPLRLADRADPPVAFTRGAKPNKAGLYAATKPYPMPITVSHLGARGEDAAYKAPWTSTVRADDKQFTATFTIPWKTLADAGIKNDKLILDVTSRGPLKSPPRAGKVFKKLVLAPAEADRPKKIALRLHFVELDDVKPGQRIFDVVVQGKVMIRDLDVIAAAGGKNRVIVRELTGIDATRTLTLELVSKTKAVTPATAPIISAIELLANPAKGDK